MLVRRSLNKVALLTPRSLEASEALPQDMRWRIGYKGPNNGAWERQT
jgi:hypothetical protein